jgi:hypothetical protein
MNSNGKMKKLTLLSFAALLAWNSTAAAVTVTGMIDETTPLADDVGVYEEDALANGWCSSNDRADVRPFTVSVTGTYGLTNLEVSEDSESLFVQINTQPGPNYFPLINADTYGFSPVAAAPEGSLDAGTSYYFVAVTACTGGAFPLNFSVDLTRARTLRPVRYTLAPDLIPSNVPTCSGSKFVSGFQIVGGGEISWYVDNSKKDECFDVDVNILPEGVNAKDMAAVLALLNQALDVYRLQ